MTDFVQARHAMVDCQVRPSDVTRYAIIDAMLQIPRERFVPKALREIAYAEADVPIGPHRCVLAPRTFAKMLEAAGVGPDDLVLDVAPGFGYSSAVLSRLAAAVVAVEPDPAMAKQAGEVLDQLEIDNVVVSEGEAAEGAAADGPFDVIFVNGGVERLPEGLTAQLKQGGRLVAVFTDGPIGQCRIAMRNGDRVTQRPVFDATAPLLAGFEAEVEFVF